MHACVRVCVRACVRACVADKPMRPRNVKLTSVDKGLRVSWEPPNELDGRPVDRYTISYGKSMRTLRFIKVDKDRRSEVLEDVGKTLNKTETERERMGVGKMERNKVGLKESGRDKMREREGE